MTQIEIFEVYFVGLLLFCF